MNIKKIIKEELDDLRWIDDISPDFSNIPTNTRVVIYLSKSYTVDDKELIVKSLKSHGVNVDFLQNFNHIGSMYTIHISNGKVTGWDSYSSQQELKDAYNGEGLEYYYEDMYSNAYIINL